MRRITRCLTFSAAVAISLPAALALPATAATTKVAKIAAPTKVKAVVVAGGVTISWGSVKGAVGYTVVSTPAGASCTAIAPKTSCTAPVTTLSPRRFSVTATNATGVSAASSPTKTFTPRLTLVVAGQSNAMGAESYAVDPTTNINYFGAPYANGADKADSLYFNEWFTQAPQASYHNSLATPQIWGSPIGTRQFFGPEIGLARQIYADTKQPATIIKTAFANTSLAVNWSLSDPKSLYYQMVNFVNARLTTDAKVGQLDVVAGFYWYQGESDAGNLTQAGDYRANLTTMLTAVRPALHMNEKAPIGLVQESLANVISVMQLNGNCPTCADLATGDTLVRAADEAAAAALPAVYVVDSLPQIRTGVGIHVANAGELAIGQQLATATESHFVT